MLSPIVPHICHRLWRTLGHESAVVDEVWPAADDNAVQADTLEIVVQVNGKLRARIQASATASKDELQDAALENENVRRFVADRNIRKVIVVPGKLVNVVV
jgi:leucyl-tRNA synthetase